MTAAIRQLAQAVADELNNTTFSQAFTATWSYRPRFELSEMATLHVTVVPKSIEFTAGDRRRDQVVVQLDIAVQKRLEDETPEEIDPLMELVHELADHFRRKRLATQPSAVVRQIRNEPIYAVEHLDQLRQFTSLLTLELWLLQ
jgi:hypothetical protein